MMSAVIASPPPSLDNTKQQEAQRVMGISRIVWDHVVSATWVRPFSPLSPKKCMRLFSAAEALFPLVARASRAVLATSNVKIWDEGPDTWKYKYRSSYFALELAARAGGGGGGERGRGRCAAWILAHRATRNPRKERLAVLRGLCVGGHLDSAKQLFVDDGDDPPMAMGEGNHVGMGMGIGIGNGIGQELWTRRCGLCWPGVVGGEGTHFEFDVRDAGRWDDAENVVGCVCKAGKLEVAKWLVSRFGVTESELCGPFVEALKGGHLDVVEWLAGIVDVEGVVTREHAAVLHEAVSRSGSIKAMEWFIDRFHPNDVKIPSMVHEFLRSKISAEEKIEGCKWLSQKFPFLEWKFGVYDGITLTWLMQHGLSKPSQHSLLSAYYYICDVNLVKWILDEFHIPVPGWELFFTVFGNWEDSVAVAKLMVQRATKLPPKVITTSIENALSVGNTAVAGWLEQTFHIIEGTPKDKLAVALTQASRKSFQWLLQHIQTESLEEEVNLALESHTLPNEVDCTLNLLQSFPLTRQRDATETRWNKFLHALALADLPSAQRICSLAEFTQSDVVRCFAPDVQVQSSKVIKWLIEKYNLTADHIKGNNIAVLCRLLSLSKTGCAEWLIKKFHITWDEVATVYWDPRFIKLSTWRMLMRIFPELTTDYIREHYMSAFTATPLNISYAIQVLGITEAEIVDYCRRRKAERGWLLEGTELWLGAHNLHL